MKIIFDFDYTLLDNGKFMADLVKTIGTDTPGYQRHLAVRKELGENYSLIHHVKSMKNDNQAVSVSKIMKRARDFMKNIDNYLFAGVLDILPALSKHELFLLSYGNAQWQRMKINNTTIKKYFKKIILAENNKIDYLHRIGKHSKDMIVINDKASEIIEMRKVWPLVEYYLVKSRYSDTPATGLVPHGIVYILKIIKKKYG